MQIKTTLGYQLTYSECLNSRKPTSAGDDTEKDVPLIHWWGVQINIPIMEISLNVLQKIEN